MTLGQKIKKLRIEKGLTQKELADKVYVTFQTVSKWEKDENEPDVSTLKSLAKLFGCSMDYLLGDEEEVEEEKPVEEQAAPVPTTVIIQRSGHICKRCNKDIPDGDVAIDKVPEHHGRTITYIEEYYHKDCLAQVIKEREREAAKKKNADASKAKKRCFGWGIAGGLAMFGLFLAVFLAGKEIHPALCVLYSVLIGYAIFADIYCIISGSYIADVFLGVASWSIKFPGLIFTWDLEGFIWVIAMKILFAVLGFLIGVLAFLLAAFLSAALAAVSFPFVLIHNIHTQYDDAL